MRLWPNLDPGRLVGEPRGDRLRPRRALRAASVAASPDAGGGPADAPPSPSGPGSTSAWRPWWLMLAPWLLAPHLRAMAEALWGDGRSTGRSGEAIRPTLLVALSSRRRGGGAGTAVAGGALGGGAAAAAGRARRPGGSRTAWRPDCRRGGRKHRGGASSACPTGGATTCSGGCRPATRCSGIAVPKPSWPCRAKPSPASIRRWTSGGNWSIASVFDVLVVQADSSPGLSSYLDRLPRETPRAPWAPCSRPNAPWKGGGRRAVTVRAPGEWMVVVDDAATRTRAAG